MKTQILVMPAWIAGIQVRTDASEDIHVSLDSSTPCWNDAIGGVLHELTEAPPSLFWKKRTKARRVRRIHRGEPALSLSKGAADAKLENSNSEIRILKFSSLSLW